MANPVDEMTRRSKLAERTFKRRFIAATGLTPIDYVQRLRIEDAKRRLERTERLGGRDRAGASGYEDPAFFRRLFKRIAGMAPGAYRKRFRIPDFARAPVSPHDAGSPVPRQFLVIPARVAPCYLPSSHERPRLAAHSHFAGWSRTGDGRSSCGTAVGRLAALLNFVGGYSGPWPPGLLRGLDGGYLEVGPRSRPLSHVLANCTSREQNVRRSKAACPRSRQERLILVMAQVGAAKRTPLHLVRRRHSRQQVEGRRLGATERRLPMESRNPSAEPQVDVLPDTAGISRRRLLPMIGAAGLAGIAPRAFSRDDGFGRPGNAVARFVYVGTYTAPGVPPGGTHPSTAVGIYAFR